jgi:hypothetical protein
MVYLAYVTPMRSGVTDRKENGFIFSFGFLEGFFPPGIPVYGVISNSQFHDFAKNKG